MVAKSRGPRTWEIKRDQDGYRDLTVTFLVQCDIGDGPDAALYAEGLPVDGSVWAFDSDFDEWLFCRLDSEVKPVIDDGEPTTYFLVTRLFSNRPTKKCVDDEVKDPLQQPWIISGNFVRYNEEAAYDRFGSRILNSAFEQVRGPQNEWDNNRPQVKMMKNFPILDLGLLSSMVDTLNDDILWGMPKRTIKLSNAPWETAYYGTCYKYYKLTLEFDIMFETFDRDLLDEGTKALHGRWSTQNQDEPGLWVLTPIGFDSTGKPVMPDATNPSHFIHFIDRSGNQAKCVLNGQGVPATGGQGIALTGATPSGGTSVNFFTATDNGFQAGDQVQVTGVNPAIYNGNYKVTSAVALAFTGTRDTSITVPYIKGGGVVLRQPAKTTGTAQRTLGSPGTIHIEKYGESNFLALQVPTSL